MLFVMLDRKITQKNGITSQSRQKLANFSLKDRNDDTIPTSMVQQKTASGKKTGSRLHDIAEKGECSVETEEHLQATINA